VRVAIICSIHRTIVFNRTTSEKDLVEIMEYIRLSQFRLTARAQSYPASAESVNEEVVGKHIVRPILNNKKKPRTAITSGRARRGLYIIASSRAQT